MTFLDRHRYLALVVPAVMMAAGAMIGCSDDDTVSPTAPSPVRAPSTTSAVGSAPTPASAGSTAAFRGEVPLDAGEFVFDGAELAFDGSEVALDPSGPSAVANSAVGSEVTLGGSEAALESSVMSSAVHKANSPGTALTATLDVPGDHDGSAFTVDLKFSEPIVGSRRRVRDNAFTVTGGSMIWARRVNRQTQSGRTVASQWQLTVEPSGSSDDVALSAPGGRSCDDDGALCTADGRSLSHALNATVSAQQQPVRTPLTATLDVPGDHDGSAFTVDLKFSEPIVGSRRRARDRAFTVTGGSITRARRVNRQTQSGRTVASQWQLTVEPSSSDTVTLSAPGGRACSDPGALCTAAGQSLSHSLEATIAPAVVTVADDCSEDTSRTCDLAITGAVIAVSPSISPGALLQMTVGIENKGSAASVATTLRYYRSTDATITTSDTEEATDTVDALAASGTVMLGEDLRAPSAAGTYYYGACVDEVTGESDTTNNCGRSIRVVVN